MEQQLMIYGAAGYAGGLMVREAVHQGLKPIIAGRQKDAPKIERLAQEFGLRTRYFTIEQAHEHLEHIAVLLNCAGPFSATTHVLVEACLARRVHYLDITGEAQVFKHCHSLHQRAQAQGVIVLPGVTIGESSIIGAGSVVTKDVPSNSIYAGVPAKFLQKIE